MYLDVKSIIDDVRLTSQLPDEEKDRIEYHLRQAGLEHFQDQRRKLEGRIANLKVHARLCEELNDLRSISPGLVLPAE